ncbi:MAG: hypothetical protein ACRELG_28300 [Gemmataceae bacterium]
MARRYLPSAILMIVLSCWSNGRGGCCRAAEPSGWLLVCPQDSSGPREPYLPQPGDLVFYTHDSLRSRLFYTLARTGKPYHAGIVVNLPDGRPAILEAGPYDYLHVYLMDALPRMRTHRGIVWVRRLRVPLTPEQSARLTAFALEQTGKRFALFRLVREVTPLRAHGTLHGQLFGSARIERPSWFCSELVVAAMAVAGLVDPHVLKPNPVYPRDLFRDCPFDLTPFWEEPRRWNCEP